MLSLVSGKFFNKNFRDIHESFINNHNKKAITSFTIWYLQNSWKISDFKEDFSSFVTQRIHIKSKEIMCMYIILAVLKLQM